MKLSQIVMVVIFSIGMGCGQVLLKLASSKVPSASTADLQCRLISLVSNWAFLAGVLLYGLLLIYWVWLLTFLPLSRAYPFTLLSIVVAAIGGALYFNELITSSFIVGITIIGIGLIILSMG